MFEMCVLVGLIIAILFNDERETESFILSELDSEHATAALYELLLGEARCAAAEGDWAGAREAVEGSQMLLTNPGLYEQLRELGGGKEEQEGV